MQSDFGHLATLWRETFGFVPSDRHHEIGCPWVIRALGSARKILDMGAGLSPLGTPRGRLAWCRAITASPSEHAGARTIGRGRMVRSTQHGFPSFDDVLARVDALRSSRQRLSATPRRRLQLHLASFSCRRSAIPDCRTEPKSLFGPWQIWGMSARTGGHCMPRLSAKRHTAGWGDIV
jgi:hypothetical protein